MFKNYCDYCEHLAQRNLLETYYEDLFRRGYQKSYSNEWGQPSLLPEEDYIDVVAGDKVLEALRQRPQDKPFFCLASFCGPHPPFNPPQRVLDQVAYEEIDDFVPPAEGELEPEKKKQFYHKRRAYKAMIRLLDDQVGRILAFLEQEELLDKTVILFCSDHGEMLGDHGKSQKGGPWKEASRVPAALRHPDFLLRKGIDTPIETIDLTATLLECSGLSPQAALSRSWPLYNDRIPARSLFPILRQDTDGVRAFAFSECGQRWEMAESERYKYVRWLRYDWPDSAPEAFHDLDRDPGELENLIDEPGLRAELDRHRSYLSYVKDSTPTCATHWVPSMGGYYD